MATRLLDEMRNLMRRRHYSIHTERAYRDWAKRHVRFHNMQSRDDLRHDEEKIEAFLTHLARDRQVAASTQNQAMSVLVFLYKHVLEQPLNDEINADRARRKVRIPVVLTREETARVIALMFGVHQLIVKLLYGSGLRITECLRLEDVDLEMKALTVRNGKGDKDRITTLPGMHAQPLKEHLVRMKVVHGQDLEEGYGQVYLPHAVTRKYPHADKDWRWQYVFFLFAARPVVLAQVLGIVYRAVSAFLVRRTGLRVGTGVRTGAVTVIQRFGSALDLNIHRGRGF